MPQDTIPPRASGLDPGLQDESTSFDSAEPFFSQPESHMPTSPSHIHGPHPRPPGPLESTPNRPSTQFMDASDRPTHETSATSRRPSSGFTKLSELRPSALRRTMSRQESPIVSASASEASADIEAMLGPGASAPDSDSSSDTESTDSDSSEEDASAPALPASKMAGATAKEDTHAKRKRTFFSALS